MFRQLWKKIQSNKKEIIILKVKLNAFNKNKKNGKFHCKLEKLSTIQNCFKL